jgi:hypothetical protein
LDLTLKKPPNTSGAFSIHHFCSACDAAVGL